MLSAPILLLVLSIREKGLHITKGDILPFALLGLLGHCLNRLCWSYGLTLTTASNASLLLAITPIHVALLATLFGIERVHRKSAAGIAVALLGVFFVLKADLVNVRFGKATLVGDVFMLGTGVLWALFTIYAKHLLQNHSILKLTAWSAQFGAAFMIPFALRSLIQGELAGISLKAWVCLLVVSFLGNALSHLFWITGIFNLSDPCARGGHFYRGDGLGRKPGIGANGRGRSDPGRGLPDEDRLKEKDPFLTGPLPEKRPRPIRPRCARHGEIWEGSLTVRGLVSFEKA